MFELTEDHLTLIRHLYVSNGFHGVEINSKRPYGDSDIVDSVLRLLLGKDFEGYYDREGDLKVAVNNQGTRKLTAEGVESILRGMADALQIVLCTGTFVAGTYMRAEPWCAHSWKLV